MTILNIILKIKIIEKSNQTIFYLNSLKPGEFFILSGLHYVKVEDKMSYLVCPNDCDDQSAVLRLKDGSVFHMDRYTPVEKICLKSNIKNENIKFCEVKPRTEFRLKNDENIYVKIDHYFTPSYYDAVCISDGKFYKVNADVEVISIKAEFEEI